MTTPQTEKPYELTYETRDGYGFATVSGPHDSYAISKAYWTEIGQKLAADGLKKVLIVEDIVEQPPMADVFNLMTEVSDMGFRGVKVAFVDRYLDHHELNDFGALVGKNRGLDGRTFNDQDEAIAWLLS